MSYSFVSHPELSIPYFIWLLHKITNFRLVFLIAAFLKSALIAVAPSIFACLIIDHLRDALFKFVFSKFTLLKLASSIEHPLRFAPFKLDLHKFTLFKLEPSKFAPLKFFFLKSAPDKSHFIQILSFNNSLNLPHRMHKKP